MLEACTNALALYPFDQSRGHDSCQVWVFRKILKVASAQWTALDVDARTEQNRDSFLKALFTQRLSHFLQKVRIETAGRRGSGWKAGGGHALAYAELIVESGLLAKAMRTIRHHDFLHSQALHSLAPPEVTAAAEPCFLFQRHLRQKRACFFFVAFHR